MFEITWYWLSEESVLVDALLLKVHQQFICSLLKDGCWAKHLLHFTAFVMKNLITVLWCNITKHNLICMIITELRREWKYERTLSHYRLCDTGPTCVCHHIREYFIFHSCHPGLSLGDQWTSRLQTSCPTTTAMSPLHECFMLWCSAAHAARTGCMVMTVWSVASVTSQRIGSSEQVAGGHWCVSV